MSRRTLVFTTTLLVILLIDQLLRFVAIQRATLWPDGAVAFGFYPNAGAIFSWPVPALVMTITTGAIIIGLSAVLFLVGWRRGEWFALGLLTMITAGAANFVDRVRFGYVVDYVSIGQWFPVFNLADILIVVGLVFIVWPRRDLTGAA
jgi:signal peptidase II